MKNFKKVLSTVLAVLMVASLCTVFASAAENNKTTVTGTNLAKNWECMGVKYSTKTDKAIAKAYNSSEYKFTEREDGSIYVDLPTQQELAGVFTTTVLENQNKTKLDNLSVTFLPENFDFTADGVGMSRTLSVVFTTEKLEDIYTYDKELDISGGIYWGNGVYTNGLRHILPEGEGKNSVCVNVTGYYWAEKVDSKIAASVSISTFDGESFNDKFDGRPGFRWSFIAKNSSETPNGDDSGLSTLNEKIYTGEGLTIEFIPDTDHGYIVTVNGNEYFDGKKCGYIPDQLSHLNPVTGQVEGDYLKRVENYTLAEDVNLKALVGVDGYVGVGGIGNKADINTNEDYVISMINNIPAAQWAGEVNTHKHTAGEVIHAVPATCESFGIDITKCTECGAVLSNTVIEQLSPTGTHDWSAWKVTKEADYTTKGEQSRECSICKKVETKEIAMLASPFDDLKAGEWYSAGCFWAYENGYMSGTSAKAFSPNAQLTRAQFVVILAKVAEADLDAVKYEALFNDVPEGEWYTKAVLWAVNNKLSSGIADKTFGTNVKVTREQLATFFMAYAKAVKIDTTKRDDLSAFEDAGKISSWALDAVKWAVAEGLLSGTTAKTITPAGIASRSQVALIFMNFVNNLLAK